MRRQTVLSSERKRRYPHYRRTSSIRGRVTERLWRYLQLGVRRPSLELEHDARDTTQMPSRAWSSSPVSHKPRLVTFTDTTRRSVHHEDHWTVIVVEREWVHAICWLWLLKVGCRHKWKNCQRSETSSPKNDRHSVQGDQVHDQLAKHGRHKKMKVGEIQSDRVKLLCADERKRTRAGSRRRP